MSFAYLPIAGANRQAPCPTYLLRGRAAKRKNTRGNPSRARSFVRRGAAVPGAATAGAAAGPVSAAVPAAGDTSAWPRSRQRARLPRASFAASSLAALCTLCIPKTHSSWRGPSFPVSPPSRIRLWCAPCGTPTCCLTLAPKIVLVVTL